MSELRILSLGGCGGFGMNATLIASERHALLVDYGIGFVDSEIAGTLRLAPDPTPILNRYPVPDAIVLTHGHDDHVGALPHLPEAWRRCPIYGLPLTLRFAADRFEGTAGWRPRWSRCEYDEPLAIGDFVVRLVRVTHSVPHSAMLAIETPVGRVIHSGDFKFDSAPRDGALSDLETLRAWGAAGVRLLMIDSTGALRPGTTPSESTVEPELERCFASARGQLFVSTFASHLHRIDAVLAAATRCGRKVGLLGRRAATTFQHGVDLGLLRAPTGLVLGLDQLRRLPPDERLYLGGGCQAESDSALARVAAGNDPRARIELGDRVIFSSSVIPGNELEVSRLIDRLLRGGAEVLHADQIPGIHVSGHASRDEIATLIDLVRPRAVVPLHGTRRHLAACQGLAEEHPSGPRQVALVERGEELLVAPDLIGLGAVVDLAPQLVDDQGPELDWDLYRRRRRAASGGVIAISIADGGRDCEIRTLGLPALDPELERSIGRLCRDLLTRENLRSRRPQLEAELAQRVAPLLRRGARYRPELIVTIQGE